MGTQPGTTTLLWDTDSGHNDCDRDGRVDSFEILHHASPCVLDTDQDGLADGDEIEGAIVGGDSLQFPYWGEKPDHKDFFLEADWEPDVNGADSLQMTPAAARMVAQIFANDQGNHAGNPDGIGGIAVHIDNGRSGGGVVYGRYGGASRLPPKQTSPGYEYCEGLTPRARGISAMCARMAGTRSRAAVACRPTSTTATTSRTRWDTCSGWSMAARQRRSTRAGFRQQDSDDINCPKSGSLPGGAGRGDATSTLMLVAE